MFNILVIIYNNLVNFVSSRKLIFFILSVSLAVASYSSIYLYSIFSYVYNTTYKGFNSMCTCIVILNNNKYSPDKAKLVNEIMNSKVFPEIRGISLRTSYSNKSGNMNLFGIDAKYPYLNISSGSRFKTADIKNVANVAIVSVQLTNASKNYDFINDRYILNDKYFRIVGIVSSYTKDIFIPITTYLKNKYDINEMKIVFSKYLNTEQKVYFRKIVSSFISSSQVIIPTENIGEETIFFILILTLITLLMVLCMLNVVTLFKYWVETNKFKFIVYKICGSSNVYVNIIIISEAFIIGFCNFVFGYIAYYFTVPYIKQFKLWYPISHKQIILILVLYMLSIYVSIASTAIKVSKSTLADKLQWR